MSISHFDFATMRIAQLLTSLIGTNAILLDPSKPDSRKARNVLEGKAEGYCSVSLPSNSHTLPRG